MSALPSSTRISLTLSAALSVNTMDMAQPFENLTIPVKQFPYQYPIHCFYWKHVRDPCRIRYASFTRQLYPMVIVANPTNPDEEAPGSSPDHCQHNDS
uniref:Uncharacterized protein n=1 Tax=mine drainage metagenome TaxID=410659 RepID=E6QHD3_9ZZZZ